MNGGPAFPHTVEEHLDCKVYMQGMSLRDYFAAKAMQGLIGHYGQLDFKMHVHMNDGEIALTEGEHDGNGSWAARAAYEIADAMLAAREAK